MNAASDDRFTLVDGIAVARIEGQVSAQQVIGWVGETLAQARRARLDRVMLVLTAANGFPAPSLARRAEMIRGWAAAAGDAITMAIVCQAELIDPQRFGIRVATSLGLHANVFDREDAAMAWLRGTD